MLKKLIFHLCFFTLLIGTINAAVDTTDEDSITLISSDGKEFIIDENAAALSKFFAAVLFGGEAFEEALARRIELDRVHSDYLSHFVKALEIAAPLYERPIASLSQNERKGHQKRVVQVLSEYFSAAHLPRHNLLHLLMTANYLLFPELKESLLSIAAHQLSLADLEPKDVSSLPTALSAQLLALIKHKNMSIFRPQQEQTLKALEQEHPIASAQFSADNNLIVATAEHERLRGGGMHGEYGPSILNIKTGKLDQYSYHSRPVSLAKLTSDNELLASAAERDRFVRVLDVKTGRILHSLEHPFPVGATSSSLDGNLMTTVTVVRFINIWNIRTGQLLKKIETSHPVDFVQFSADNKLIVTASESLQVHDPFFRIWDVQTGELLHTLRHSDEEKSGKGTFAQFSSDNKLLVTSTEYNIHIWNLETGQQLHTLDYFYEYSSIYGIRVGRSVQFSPDDKRIIATVGDQTARIVDVQTGEELYKLEGYTSPISSAEFSPNNRLIATASSMDQTAKIWNAKTGELLHTLKHPVRVGFAHFSPDSNLLVTPWAHGDVRISDVNYLLSKLESKDVIDNLTFQQALLIKMLSKQPKGHSFVSLANLTAHFSPGSLRLIFDSFSPPIQNYLHKKYGLKIVTLEQRRRRMQRRLALRRRRLQARG